MKGLGVLLCFWAGMLSPTGCDQVQRVEIDTSRLRQMAEDVGVVSGSPGV